MASPGRTTPASKARPPGSAAGRGQLLRHSSFYPGVIPVDQEKNHSLLLRGNQMKTGGAVGNKPKNKKSKNGNTSEFGNFPKPAAKAKRKVPPDVKERQARFDAMIEGNLTNLPPLPKSAVRIFLSSTFSDMRAERNTLAREVYPILKEYCASLDLDFQVVDMRWGITEDSQNDHSVEDLCLREITNCQNLSLGPNFVCILGDRYGFQLIPSKVCVEEFELLLSETADTDHEGSVLLRKWYLKDENAVPNVYVLQPIRTHFPHYGLHNPGEEEVSAKDSAEWYSTVKRLRRVLRDGAVILHKKGHLSDQNLQQYFWSVTECEINTGVLQTKNPGNHALFFHRELIGLAEACADDEAGIYIDISEGDSVDTEARNGLKTLSTKTIPKKLGEDRRFHFSLPWRSGGVDPSKCHEHAVYISEFCKKFILNITQLIEDAHEKRQSFIKQSEYYSEPDEIIHHLQFCVEKCKTFCGRKETLCSIRTYVLDQSARKPLVIHAESGAGKTSLMAYVMHSLPKWIGQPYIGVIRFLGTSPGTVDLYDVLFSLCGQLADATDLIMEPIGYQNFTSLVQYMPRFLRRAASAAKVPIVILLDSVDQLSPANQAYCMKWLPLSLPPNVKLVLSTLSKENDILVSAKNHLTDQKCYIEVPILPKETVQEILIKYLSSNNRTLTADQSFLVTSKFFQDPCPLYLKLLLDKAMTWHSFTQLPDMVLGENSQKAIHLLFEGLEIKYGNILIHAALGYLTVSLNGITQIELEDVLSCDNDVLDDVYRFHDPPVEGIVRIPQVLWARIYNDLKQYLVERLSQGKTTMFWYHRQFIEVAKERYLTGNNAQRFHKKMLEIYLEETGVQRDIHLSKRQKTIKQADRQVTHQPMVIKNKRKMECITHHLLNAKSEVSMDTAKQMVYCNYDFLTTKVSAFSVKHVVSELDRFLIERPDKEIKAIRDFMQSSFADLRYPMQLAVHLLAGVPNAGGCIHLEKLLKEAKSRVTNHPKPLLVPEGPCFAPREQSDEALHNCLVGCKDILCSTENMICTEEEGLEGESVLAVLDANSGEHRVFEQLRLKQYITKPLIVERDVFLACETALVACNMDNGDIAEEAVPYKLSPDENVVRCLVSEKDKLLGVFGSSGELQVWDVVTRTKTANIHLSDWTDITFIGYSNNGGKLLVCGEKGTSGVLLEVAPGDTENETIVDIPYAIRSGSLCILKDVPFVIGCSDPYRNLSDIYIVGQRPFKLLQTIKVEQRILCLEMIKTTIGPLSCVISDHGSVYLHDLLNGQLTAKYELDDGVPNCVLPTPILVRGVECILTGGSSGTIAFHSLEDTTQVAQIKAFESPVKGVRLLGSKLVAYAENTQLKVWDFVSLLEGDGILCANTDDPNRSLYDETVTTNIELSLCSRFIYTVTTTQLICVWEVESGNLKASYSCGLQPTEMYVARGEMELLVLFDKTSGTVRILSGRSGEEVLSKIPNYVLSVTLTKDKSKLYLITDMDGRLKLYEYELLRCRLSRSFSLQKGLGFTSVAGILSQTERYMVLKVECTAEDKKAIESQWKKGGFVPQPHPYRFSAIDLTHTSGALLHCYRQLSKIPALGSAIIAYTGNTMIFCVRRCVCFWDIPTGRCDQMITKSGRHGMFYNPSWLGGGDSDANAFVRHIVQSDDKNFVIMGSDDGYAATYKADTGAPVKMKAPLTKHIAPVCYLAVSGDSRWMFSVCRKHYLKMWDLNTAEELFSLRLDGKIRAVRVSPDSRHLALLTGSVITRVMLFRIMPGKQEPKKSNRPEIE